MCVLMFIKPCCMSLYSMDCNKIANNFIEAEGMIIIERELKKWKMRTNKMIRKCESIYRKIEF